MNLIEQLGGYAKAKEFYGNFKDDSSSLNRQHAINAKAAMLEYRRQHNIFEEGDKIVFVDDFMHGELMTVAWTRTNEVWMDGGSKRCTDLSMIRHAKLAELEAGHRS